METRPSTRTSRLKAALWHIPAFFQSALWETLAYWTLVCLGITLIWSGKYLPLVDMAQNAGQISALRDIIRGDFLWGEFAELNLFTPYLVGYIPAAILSLIIPVRMAMGIILTVSFLLYLLAGNKILKRFNADRSFNFIFCFSFFGFAWQWGLFTFLVAMPIGLFFILHAHRYAENPTSNEALKIVLFGTILFLTHGTVFIYCSLIGGWLLLYFFTGIKALIKAVLPYIALATLFCTHTLLISDQIIPGQSPIINDTILTKLLILFSQLVSGNVSHLLGNLQPTLKYPLLIILMSLFITIPITKRIFTRYSAFFSGFILLWITIPSLVFGQALLYQRFAVYFFPLLAPLFPQNDHMRATRNTLIPVMSAIIICAKISASLTFQTEVQDYASITADLKNGQRAISLVFDTASIAADEPYTYLHFPLWYQVDHHGWVDVNFAYNYPLLVHYKKGHFPSMALGDEWKPQNFDWEKSDGKNYRYFIIRMNHTQSDEDIAAYFRNNFCEVHMAAAKGQWRIFENTGCTPPTTQVE